jgi:diaminopimelate decarboxylase/aspartate kinase
MTTTNSTPTATHPRFVVLKFGGTSVATGARWRTILDEARLRVQDGLRPVVVCSAISKVSDQLEQLVSAALRGEHAPVLAALRARHEELAAELGVDVESAIGDELRELERLALGASLVRERSPRLLARTMAMGELLATKLGAAFLNAQGLPTAWIDARTCLQSTPDPLRGDAMNILSATVHDDHEPGLYARFSTLPQSCVLTQGFIASGAASVHGTHSEDSTVLLGRGGSDTSAALFAARLQAERCEIWTDVPGIFTADPRGTPDALLVKSVSYDEAQEIASMGAKVLHPRSIAPCRRHHIPMEIRWTERPRFAGTVLDAGRAAGEGQVKAISAKRGVTLVSMETAGMWQQVGFLADAFACFKARGLSVDLVSTSEMNVTVSLDASANTLDAATLDALVHDLNRHCRARLIPGCAAVSLVGRRIRAILHQLGPVLAVFEEQRIHLVSQAASDLNLTFVVDEDQVDRLVHDLHALLFGQGTPSADTFGPSWSALFRSDAPGEHASGNAHVPAWWRARRDSLVEMSNNESPLYVLDEDTLDDNIAQLRALHSIDRIFYALKANPHVAVLEKLAAAGMGFECVSQGEVEHVRRTLRRAPR